MFGGFDELVMNKVITMMNQSLILADNCKPIGGNDCVGGRYERRSRVQIEMAIC